MRISDFAKKNNMSVDTIRYYIKEHLLHPLKKGNYYYFNENNQIEISKLLKLKSYKFSLKEIKNLFFIDRLSDIKYLDTNTFIKNIYLSKKKQLESEIASLNNVKNDLVKEIAGLPLATTKKYKCLGLPLSFVEHLSCPLCNKQLILNTAVITNNSIQQGESLCDCGFKLNICDGIIIPYTKNVEILDPLENTSISNVLDNSPSSFMEFMFSSIEQLVQSLLIEDLKQKIILDIKASMGILPLQFLKHNSSFKYFILLDDDINKLRVVKDSVESLYQNPNIIYICCDLYNLPISYKLIDIAIDFLGSFVNGFRLKENTYSSLMPYLKRSSIIVGLYLYFKKFDMLSRLPNHLTANFNDKAICHYLESNGYSNKLPKSETCLKEGNNVGDFFKPNDEVFASIRFYERKNTSLKPDPK